MLSRLTGSNQSEKASQEQVSDKAGAGVAALTRLVQIVRKDSGTKVLAQASKDLNITADRILHTQQEASRPMLETAQTYFQQKKYDLCLLSLHTLAQAFGGTDESEAQALSVICKIHKHAALQEWHKVLGVPTDATEAEAKRQYRKLAAVVHPDKCTVEGSEEAFKLLGKSAACLTSQSDTNSGRDAQPTDGGPTAAWWEDWDPEDAPSRKRKHPTSKPSAEDAQEDHGLASLGLQELQAEVRRRQAAVLRPEPGSEEEGLNAFQRQKRLRVARTVLGECLQRANSTTGRGFC